MRRPAGIHHALDRRRLNDSMANMVSSFLSVIDFYAAACVLSSSRTTLRNSIKIDCIDRSG
jgi:hypothetical protein